MVAKQQQTIFLLPTVYIIGQLFWPVKSSLIRLSTIAASLTTAGRQLVQVPLDGIISSLMARRTFLSIFHEKDLMGLLNLLDPYPIVRSSKTVGFLTAISPSSGLQSYHFLDRCLWYYQRQFCHRGDPYRTIWKTCGMRITLCEDTEGVRVISTKQTSSLSERIFTIASTNDDSSFFQRWPKSKPKSRLPVSSTLRISSHKMRRTFARHTVVPSSSLCPLVAALTFRLGCPFPSHALRHPRSTFTGCDSDPQE